MRALAGLSARMRNGAGLALLVACLAARRAPRRGGELVSPAKRLAMLATRAVPVSCPVRIDWSDQLVPFIEARSDEDLATALGLVHAHLRLGQMEMMRHLAEGRVSEMIGPIGIDLDHLLRILDFGHAAREIEAGLPARTRQWVEGFVRGINHHLHNAEALPHEFGVFGLERRDWTVADIVRIGRLAAADVNWLLWFQLLRLSRDSDWPAIWQRLLRADAAPASDELDARAPLLAGGALGLTGRWASNAVAIGAARSSSGGALIASDPHLAIQLPVPWIIAAYKSPGHHAVGLMPAGLPFIAMGRNRWIAWGGTNLHAASSDFYDVSTLPQESLTATRERIAVRWWPDREVTVRRSPLGPIVSDARLPGLDPDRPVALRWMGHLPSDEFTAMLDVNRARDWDEFRAAIEQISVSGQTMIYADTKGRAGRAMAVRLPWRRGECWDLVLNSSETGHWQRFAGSADLPAELPSPARLEISANERPGESPVPVGLFFSPSDRARRLGELLGGEGKIGAGAIRQALGDVYQPAAHALAREFARRIGSPASPPAERAQASLEECLAAWKGRYEAHSRGALAFELVFHHFLQAAYGRARRRAFLAMWNARDLVLADIRQGALGDPARALAIAVRRARRPFRRYRSWGAMHRLKLAHPLARVPLAGRRYVISEEAAAGSRDTVYATGHVTGASRHGAIYGIGARHVSDLSDPDRNEFILLGGQDGWRASAAHTDQAALWRAGGTVQVPLGLDAARARFSLRTDLLPAIRAETGPLGAAEE